MWNPAGDRLTVFFDQGLLIRPLEQSNWLLRLEAGATAAPIEAAVSGPLDVRLRFVFPLHDRAVRIAYRAQPPDVRNERGVPAPGFEFPLA
jgi:hypothetical protein